MREAAARPDQVHGEISIIAISGTFGYQSGMLVVTSDWQGMTSY